ncbi:succinate dehydrogenase assembly factor 4, mitochondrial [Nerophis ophidion]|uniref:succinate dehydrogenase assembly factor 4, mitochondrial n=1 Tax=Nerophis ophidion TaxID=159077 RepID=UPI002ADF139A|nr:succinate dehydrogenase assembly factor 4, mitochondrial [Nerophis ophidion]
MSRLSFCVLSCKHLLSKSPVFGPALTGRFRAGSGLAKDREPLKKAKTPQGRLDNNEEEKTKDVLERFQDDVNPVTKEKGGPRGPEPTRYGDWERKGRCVDF